MEIQRLSTLHCESHKSPLSQTTSALVGAAIFNFWIVTTKKSCVEHHQQYPKVLIAQHTFYQRCKERTIRRILKDLIIASRKRTNNWNCENSKTLSWRDINSRWGNKCRRKCEASYWKKNICLDRNNNKCVGNADALLCSELFQGHRTPKSDFTLYIAYEI